MGGSRAGWALTVLVVALAFVYRFNALGGSIGGFDGDHFIYYVGTTQVLLGERPLRDFADGGLQGAWPALTYELPALAQRLGGQTLLTEAVYTIGLLSLALGLLFRSAASLAGPLAALVLTVLTLFASTRLYGYPKVLVFSVAVALLIRYARRPTPGTTGLLAVWSVVAFLFRHDYLVYLAPTVGLLMLTLPVPDLRARMRGLALYAGLTALLLVTPLYSIEHFVGVRQYVESARALTDAESRRTNLRWPTFEATDGGALGFLANEQNAAATLYYACLAVPYLALAALLMRPALPGLDVPRSRALILSLVLLTFLLNRFLLRGNLPARFGDLGAPIAVLAAWLPTVGRTARTPIRIVTWIGATAVLVVVTLAVGTTGSVWQELDTTGLRDSVAKIGRRFATIVTELGALPPPAVGGTPSATPHVADYLRTCTLPTDRALVVADSAEVAALASRPFAAGQPTFRPGFYTLPGDQALMIRRLRSQAVPVILTDDEATYEQNFVPGFPRIHAYLQERYVLAGELPALTGGPMRVFVRRDQRPTGSYRETGLPCFG